MTRSVRIRRNMARAAAQRGETVFPKVRQPGMRHAIQYTDEGVLIYSPADGWHLFNE